MRIEELILDGKGDRTHPSCTELNITADRRTGFKSYPVRTTITGESCWRSDFISAISERAADLETTAEQDGIRLSTPLPV